MYYSVILIWCYYLVSIDGGQKDALLRIGGPTLKNLKNLLMVKRALLRRANIKTINLLVDHYLLFELHHSAMNATNAINAMNALNARTWELEAKLFSFSFECKNSGHKISSWNKDAA